VEILTPTVNPQIINWFEQIGFFGDGTTPEQINRVINFVFLQEEGPVPIFFENKTILKAAQLAFELYQGEERKVGGDPYFKHPLKTAYLCAEMINPDELGEFYWEIMVAAGFLHDVIEIRRDKDDYNVEQLTKDLIEAGVGKQRAERIAYLTDKLTPKPKKEKTSLTQRRGDKQADFLRIWEEICDDWLEDDKEVMARILRLVKVADIWANLEEMVEDLPLIEDGTFAGKPLVYTIGVFRDRIEYLGQHRDSMSEEIIDRLEFSLSRLLEFANTS